MVLPRWDLLLAQRMRNSFNFHLFTSGNYKVRVFIRKYFLWIFLVQLLNNKCCPANEQTDLMVMAGYSDPY